MEFSLLGDHPDILSYSLLTSLLAHLSPAAVERGMRKLVPNLLRLGVPSPHEMEQAFPSTPKGNLLLLTFLTRLTLPPNLFRLGPTPSSPGG